MKKKMKMKKKTTTRRHGISKPKSRHGHKYSKYKKCLNMMMLICIKQRLSSIWSSIHKKVKQHWSWVEKRVADKKSVYNGNNLTVKLLKSLCQYILFCKSFIFKQFMA